MRVSPLAKWWPFEVVGRKKGVDEDVVQVSGIRGCDLMSGVVSLVLL